MKLVLLRVGIAFGFVMTLGVTQNPAIGGARLAAPCEWCIVAHEYCQASCYDAWQQGQLTYEEYLQCDRQCRNELRSCLEGCTP